MVEESVNTPSTQKHTLRLVIASTLGVLLFAVCIAFSLYFGARQEEQMATKDEQSIALQQSPYYNPPLSKETLLQVSATALPSLNTLIEGNMLPFEPAPKKAPALYKTHKAENIPENGPKIAIIIDDMGVNTSETERVMNTLPKEVTFAFLPYGSGSLKQAHTSYKNGHEIMVHIPMEALENAEGQAPNPGENALYTSLDKDELYNRTLVNIKPFLSLAVGANNHMGSKMTSNAKALRPALRAISDNKLFFLDSLTTAKSRVKEAAKDLPLPILTRDVFLDHYQDSASINKALARTLEKAQKNGSAIAIGHPYPETTEAIANWIQTLPVDVRLVPITALLKE
ncbi:MAG: divergent polysaccharide deacetylase family protein [Alphaproteobacteria bacterium]|nr:divergent polysaccharide deacetylase family protein [Alphaproteobacteria bacterium]